jgi:hypothetical protein
MLFSDDVVDFVTKECNRIWQETILTISTGSIPHLLLQLW